MTEEEFRTRVLEQLEHISAQNERLLRYLSSDGTIQVNSYDELKKLFVGILHYTKQCTNSQLELIGRRLDHIEGVWSNKKYGG